MPYITLCDPKFCVDSKFSVRFGVAHRNRELEAQIGEIRQIKNYGIPVQADRTEPKFELTIEKYTLYEIFS